MDVQALKCPQADQKEIGRFGQDAGPGKTALQP
jgi:hypothetical protein